MVQWSAGTYLEDQDMWWLSGIYRAVTLVSFPKAAIEDVHFTTALDAEYPDAFACAPRRTLLFADRFPFRYLADDYNLDCIAAFPGCSSESAASFRTIATLARKVDELGLTTIFTSEAPAGRLAETVRAATLARNQRIVPLDSMQTLPRDWQNRSYIDAMGRNCQAALESLTD